MGWQEWNGSARVLRQAPPNSIAERGFLQYGVATGFFPLRKSWEKP
jgi:hypothetical protein